MVREYMNMLDVAAMLSASLSPQAISHTKLDLTLRGKISSRSMRRRNVDLKSDLTRRDFWLWGIQHPRIQGAKLAKVVRISNFGKLL